MVSTRRGAVGGDHRAAPPRAGSSARLRAISAATRASRAKSSSSARPRANSSKQPLAGRAAPRRRRRAARRAGRAASARSAGQGGPQPGVLHLHRDRAPVGQPRAVHLRDRRGAERAGLEVREGLLERRARARASTRRAPRGRGGAARGRAAPRRRSRASGGQRVVAQRGELAELRVGALQVPEGGREALGLALAPDRAPRRRSRRGRSRRSERLAEASAEDRGAAAREAEQGDERERAPAVARRDPGRGGGGLRERAASGSHPRRQRPRGGGHGAGSRGSATFG